MDVEDFLENISQDQFRKLIYRDIKNWVDQEKNENNHDEQTAYYNFEMECKILSQWLITIKDDYHKYDERG